MDELLSVIYELTVKMENCLIQEDFVEFDLLLNKREIMMTRVEAEKYEHLDFHYSLSDVRLLKEIYRIDKRLNPLLKGNISKTQASLTQIKKSKQISKSYQPFIQQTNGVFLDKKK
ncbi:hypothetical protein ABE288_14700 [Bacillus salipaludis]|uniref:hypothetical protein n=1 Tax=Bacillus salipaludis TaxID=2547811 RepID=UPI003D1D6C91